MVISSKPLVAEGLAAARLRIPFTVISLPAVTPPAPLKVRLLTLPVKKVEGSVIAEALAKKEHVLIKPSGQYALNKVGLSTQVPMRLVFLTTGNSKRIQIGNNEIIFKSTTSKKLSMKGDITSLLFLGLQELDLQKISPTQMVRIMELLRLESPDILNYNLRLAPSKVSDFVVKNLLNATV